jgi:hypothetical protein
LVNAQFNHEEYTMALSQSELIRLLESLRSTDGIELIRTIAERMVRELIEAEASAHIGAEWNEHTPTRTTIRNGHRDKVLTTLADDLDLEIPKVRTGSFFPSLLERRRRIDQALYAVIMEAYVHGVSTRSVDDLVKALGRGQRHLQVGGLTDLRGAGRTADRVPHPPARSRPLPLRLPGRDLLQGTGQPPDRLAGRRRRHRHHRRRQPRGPRPDGR